MHKRALKKRKLSKGHFVLSIQEYPRIFAKYLE